ncbi:MAG: hypothetical protein HY920_06875 [Elusimicrobia bacterium]|nr:hypothetical protein [Elusimicrobiota bacterium]
MEDSAQKRAPRYYIFDIWIAGTGGVCDYKVEVLRRIQIAETKSLYNFAKVITKAFGFYFDHCFEFYDNFQRYPDSKKSYELFVDIGEAPLEATGSVLEMGNRLTKKKQDTKRSKGDRH